MFKRAKVLKVFNKDNIRKESYSTLYTFLKKNNLNDIVIYPDLKSDKLIESFIPGTLFCLTQNINLNFAFFCFPAGSSHIQKPIAAGESVWYFEDSTFNEKDTIDSLLPRYYWTERISGNISTELLLYTESDRIDSRLFKNKLDKKAFVDNLDLISSHIEDLNKTQIDLSGNLNNIHFANNSELCIQGTNNNVISLGYQDYQNKISSSIDIVAGENFYSQEKDIDDLLLNDTLNYENSAARISLHYRNISNKFSLFDDVLSDVMVIIDKREDLQAEQFSYSTISQEKNNIISYEEKENYSKKVNESNVLENSHDVVLNKKTFDDQSKPNIFITSSDINIVSRYNMSQKEKIILQKEYEEMLDEEDALIENNTMFESFDAQGEIRILKEGSNPVNSSQILLNNNNEVFLDGKTIYIGNFNRFLIDKNLIDEKSASQDPLNTVEKLSDTGKDALKELCGKGDSILLGYEKSLSEPLVLGNTLMILLRDMIDLTQLTIDQNKTLNDKVNALAQEYSSHNHLMSPSLVNILTPAGAPAPFVGQTVPVPNQPPMPPSIVKHQTFTSSDTVSINNNLTDIQEKLDQVKSNLKYILSRFVKTS